MPRSLALALLALATAMPAAAAVERGEHRIRLTLEGVGGMANDAGCPAQPGKEVIEGTVKGNEALLTSTSKSVEYIGTLDRKSNTVICDLEGQEDQTDYCVTQLTGSSKVELTIRIYADRPGAYLEWHPIGKVTVSAKGDCDAELTDLARSAYLTEGGFAEIATVPKGALVDDKSHVEIGGGSSAKLEVLPKVGIQAKPGGPYSIERAATIVLDGSGSTPSQGHAIQSYEWKLTPTGKPDGCAGIGSPTTMTGATVTFVALCSVAAELTVRDDGGEQDTDEVEVTVKARPWQTKFTTDDAIRQESFTFVANGFVFGYNRCRRAGHFDENSNHWYEPRAVGSHDFEQSSFWLGQVTDGGPFAGIHFVTRGDFEIQRALWVNKKLYPGGEVYDLNPGPK